MVCNVLIHKRGNTTDPATFRPITLEAVPLQITTPYIHNLLFAFLSANKYVDNTIQKGFLPKLTGTFEHTAHMANILSTARIRQSSAVITLFDLKNFIR